MTKKWHLKCLGATHGLDWRSCPIFFMSTSKYIKCKKKYMHAFTEIWQSLTDDLGILGKELLLDSLKCTKSEVRKPPPLSALGSWFFFPLVLNSRAITFHKELKKTLLQELYDSMGWSYSRGNGNVNKQSEAISWSRARKGRELVGAVQVSSYIPWGRTLAAMHRRAGSYLEELQKRELLYSCHGWKWKRAKFGTHRFSSLVLHEKVQTQ